jgi:two-component system, OmpR family, response regulator
LRILLIEDDIMIGEAIQMALRDVAYSVDWNRDGSNPLTNCEEYAAIILDLGLPGQDGLEILAKLRKLGSEVPILIVTARDAMPDKVRGLDLGADDYLVKPFEIEELLARIRSISRRRTGSPSTYLTNDLLSLSLATHEVWVSETSFSLSRREFSLLHALLIRPGAVLSRSQLEERVYGWNESPESNAIDFLIHAIRQKIGADSILNIRGIGWSVRAKSRS